MLSRLLNAFSGLWLSVELPNRDYRRRLLAISLGVLGLISLLFYWVSTASSLYDARPNLVITAVTWCLIPLALVQRLFFPVMHMACTGIAVSLWAIAAETGGINSPQTVWLLIFPLPVISAGMIPTFESPGLINPGQFGPMIRVFASEPVRFDCA